MLQVTPQQRDHAKQLTYGLLYGMGAAKLADELGCSVAEARQAQVGMRAGSPAPLGCAWFPCATEAPGSACCTAMLLPGSGSKVVWPVRPANVLGAVVRAWCEELDRGAALHRRCLH